MTAAEAKEILCRCRPGTTDAADPEVTDALEFARRDPGLAKWWETEQAWQGRVRTALRSLEPPAALRRDLGALIHQRRLDWWRSGAGALALAAAVALLLGGWWWWAERSGRPGGSFEIWRQRMARTALREYRMDLVTNNLAAVEAFLVRTNHHDHLSVPKPVETLPVVGGAALRFQNQAVSMICFDRGGGQLLWVFAMNRSALPDAPKQPQFQAIGGLATATWSAGDQVVLVAVLGDERLLRGFL